MIQGHVFQPKYPNLDEHKQLCIHVDDDGEVCGRSKPNHATPDFIDLGRADVLVPGSPTPLSDATRDVLAPLVMHEFHGSLSFMNGPSQEGTFALLSNGFARFTSDDGKVVTLIRKEFLSNVTSAE